MSQDKPDQEFAFPGLNAEFTGIDSDGFDRYAVQPTGGMTLRDYFAAKAMQTLLAKNDRTRTEIVEDAYGTADAMLKARSA